MKVTGTIPRGCPKMRWIDRLKSDMRIYDINPEMTNWQRMLVCHGEKRRHHLNGRRRKRLVTVVYHNHQVMSSSRCWRGCHDSPSLPILTQSHKGIKYLIPFHYLIVINFLKRLSSNELFRWQHTMKLLSYRESTHWTSLQF